MLKWIMKLGTTPQEIDEATVEVKIEPPEKTVQEIFDEAVREVQKKKMHSVINRELLRFVYGDLQVKYAGKDLKDVPEKDRKGLKVRYAFGVIDGHRVVSSEVFNEDLVDKLINNYLEEEEKTNE